MKKAAITLGVLVILLLGFIFNILFSTGFFRKIPENATPGTVVQSIPLKGVEDLQIVQRAGFAILSSDDRHARMLGEPAEGGLYFVDLTVSPFTYEKLEIDIPNFRPHGISIFPIDSTHYKLWVINHADGKHSVEELMLSDRKLVFIRSYSSPFFISPNDLVAVGESQFYLTNDHKNLKGFKRFAEDYLGLSQSNVIYFDGIQFSEAATGIGYANGINYDPINQLLFVGSSREFCVKVYKEVSEGNLDFIESVPLPAGADNIEWDQDGNLLIGCHPNLMTFAGYAKGKKDKSPSEIIQLTYNPSQVPIIKSIFLNDGSLVSASSVAGSYDGMLIIGNVKDDHVLVWTSKLND